MRLVHLRADVGTKSLKIRHPYMKMHLFKRNAFKRKKKTDRSDFWV